MKKVLLYLALFSLLLSPILVLAQEGPKECCRIRREVKIHEKKCVKGSIAAPDLDRAKEFCKAEKESEDGTKVGDKLTYCKNSGEKWGLFCLMSTIYYVTDWIFTILLLVAVIMMIYGGFTMLTSMGSEESFTRGRNIIMYAVAGVGVAVVARLIPAIVRAVMGI